jgi:predicted nucleotidyltransferase
MERSDKATGSAKHILSILKNLKSEIRLRYKAEVKGILGSYVRGDQNAVSDIDVLVEFDEGANLLDLTGLSLFLEEKLNCRVDVVPEDAIRKELRPAILRETAYI